MKVCEPEALIVDDEVEQDKIANNYNIKEKNKSDEKLIQDKSVQVTSGSLNNFQNNLFLNAIALRDSHISYPTRAIAIFFFSIQFS